jgi:hypothetical protein
VVNAWNRLAVSLDALQNNCTYIGRMDRNYTVDIPAKAFILDNSTK